MTTVLFRTNLDEAQKYVDRIVWVGPVPRVSDEIQFKVGCKETRYFSLRVCAVTWDPNGTMAHVELHVPACFGGRSIADWMEHMKRLEGRV